MLNNLFPTQHSSWQDREIFILLKFVIHKRFKNLWIRKRSIQIFCPFFDWVVSLLLSCMSSLCISDINPLSDTWFESVFSQLLIGFSFCQWFPLLCRRFLVWCSCICLFFLLFPFSGQTRYLKICAKTNAEEHFAYIFF